MSSRLCFWRSVPVGCVAYPYNYNPLTKTKNKFNFGINNEFCIARGLFETIRSFLQDQYFLFGCFSLAKTSFLFCWYSREPVDHNICKYFHFLPEPNFTNKLQEVQVKRFSCKTFFAAIVPFCSEKF